MIRKSPNIILSYSGSEQTQRSSNLPIFSVIWGKIRGGVCENVCMLGVVGGSRIIFAVFASPWDDLIMILVPFFCCAGLRFNGSWVTCFHLPPPNPAPAPSPPSSPLSPLKYTLPNPARCQNRRAKKVDWTQRQSELSFHVLFCVVGYRGMGSGPVQTYKYAEIELTWSHDFKEFHLSPNIIPRIETFKVKMSSAKEYIFFHF